MACLEHFCTICKFSWANNIKAIKCPRCGYDKPTNEWDEQHTYNVDTEDYENGHLDT